MRTNGKLLTKGDRLRLLTPSLGKRKLATAAPLRRDESLGKLVYSPLLSAVRLCGTVLALARFCPPDTRLETFLDFLKSR